MITNYLQILGAAPGAGNDVCSGARFPRCPNEHSSLHGRVRTHGGNNSVGSNIISIGIFWELLPTGRVLGDATSSGRSR